MTSLYRLSKKNVYEVTPLLTPEFKLLFVTIAMIIKIPDLQDLNDINLRGFRYSEHKKQVLLFN